MRSDRMEQVDEASWDSKVLRADKPVVVDFWAEWCGPCKAQTNLLEDLRDDLGERVRFVQVDIDGNEDLTARYGIRAVPTVMLLRDGEVRETLMGITDKDALKSKLLPHLG